MKRVKCITNRHPLFLKEAYRHDNLLDLQNDARLIKRNEPFLIWDDGCWYLYRMDDPPRMCGVYREIRRAVFFGRKIT